MIIFGYLFKSEKFLILQEIKKQKEGVAVVAVRTQPCDCVENNSHSVKSDQDYKYY